MVDTATDGNGLFSFTFRRGEPDLVWAVTSTGAANSLVFPCYGAEQLIVPSGWNGSLANGLVSLGYGGSENPVFLDGVTFSVRSSSVGTMLYDGATLEPGGRGLVSGLLYTYPTPQLLLGGGFTTFSFIGPAAVPEPSAGVLLLAATPFLRRAFRRKLSAASEDLSR